MRSPRTLQGRLSLAAVAVGAVAVVALTAAFDVVLLHVQRVQVENLLHDSTTEVRRTILVRDGRLVLPPESAGDIDTNVWVFQGATLLDAPKAPAWLDADARALAGTHGRLVRHDEPRAVALYSAAVRDGSRQVGTVVATVSVGPYNRSYRIALVGSVVLATLLLALLGVLTRVFVGRALAPVGEMTEHARAWSDAEAGQRFGATPRPTELAHLAGTLDDLLDRVTAVLRREQRLTAEISHELRTPLAAILAETDLHAARRRSPAESAATVETVAGLARRMEGILETLLSAARAPSATGRAEADAVVVAAVEGLGATRVPVVRTGTATGLALGVEPALAERALAPLLENAVRHARSRVEVRVASDGPVVRIEVSDDGDGVPPMHAEEVFEPGFRLERDGEGAGLGLALARRLARAADGDVTCAGATFVLALPRG